MVVFISAQGRIANAVRSAFERQSLVGELIPNLRRTEFEILKVLLLTRTSLADNVCNALILQPSMTGS